MGHPQHVGYLSYLSSPKRDIPYISLPQRERYPLYLSSPKRHIPYISLPQREISPISLFPKERYPLYLPGLHTPNHHPKTPLELTRNPRYHQFAGDSLRFSLGFLQGAFPPPPLPLTSEALNSFAPKQESVAVEHRQEKK